MARLITCGFDIPVAGTATTMSPEGEGQTYSANTVAFDTTVKHGSLGYSSLSISGSTGLNGKYSAWNVGSGSPNFTMSLDRDYYLRLYLRIAGSPSSQLEVVSTSGGNFTLRMETSRALRLYDSTGTAVGSASSALSTGTWYEVSLRYRIPTSGDGELELRVDKSVVSSVSCDVGSGSIFGSLRVGVPASVSVGTTLYIDDLALHDDQGSSFNTWPETGYCMLLRPVGDSSIGNWEQPATSGRDTTGLYQAVDNTVPVGVAHSDADANNLRYIFNILSGSNNDYVANIDDYANGGVPAGAIIRVVQGVVRVSVNSLTGTNLGSLRIASNPTTAFRSFNFETGEGSSGAVAGTEPTGWKTVKTPPATNPAVTRGTDPSVTIRKSTSTTRAAMCDLVALLVEYNDSPTLSPSGLASTAGVGVAHIELVTEQPLSPAGLGSTVALGEASIGAALSPAGVASGAAAGIPALSVALAPEGLASTTALGVAALTSVLRPAGLASGAALGDPALSVSLAPAGIAAVSDAGAPTFSVASTPAGIGSASAIGSAGVGVSLSTSGIESGAALGTVTLSAGLAPIGIATTTTFGEPSLSVPVSVMGIAATVAMGVPALASALGPVGIASTEQLGEPSVTVEIAPAGIGSGLTFGAPTLATPLSVAGIASTSEVGIAAIGLGLAPAGIASSEAFGAPTIAAPLTPGGVVSGASVGDAALAIVLSVVGLPSSAAVGTPGLSDEAAMRLPAHHPLHRVRAAAMPPLPARYPLHRVRAAEPPHLPARGPLTIIRARR